MAFFFLGETIPFHCCHFKIILYPFGVFSPYSRALSGVVAAMTLENLLGALLRIKELIRQKVESGDEEDTDERGMTRRLEDILAQSSGEKHAKSCSEFGPGMCAFA